MCTEAFFKVSNDLEAFQGEDNVFCEFLALCWESHGTGIIAKPINERYAKPRLYSFTAFYSFFIQLPLTSPSPAN